MPTAQLSPEIEAITPWKAASPPGVTLGTMAQCWPFQCSTNDLCKRATVAPSTAQTLLLDTIATDLSQLEAPSWGLGTFDQFLPFQCSMSGVVGEGMPGPGPASPTAQAFLAEVADDVEVTAPRRARGSDLAP